MKKQCNLCGLREDTVDLVKKKKTWCLVHDKEVDNKLSDCENWHQDTPSIRNNKFQIANNIKQSLIDKDKDDSLEAKPPNIVQNIKWLRIHGIKHYKILIICAVVLVLWIPLKKWLEDKPPKPTTIDKGRILREFVTTFETMHIVKDSFYDRLMKGNKIYLFENKECLLFIAGEMQRNKIKDFSQCYDSSLDMAKFLNFFERLGNHYDQGTLNLKDIRQEFEVPIISLCNDKNIREILVLLKHNNPSNYESLLRLFKAINNGMPCIENKPFNQIISEMATN